MNDLKEAELAVEMRIRNIIMSTNPNGVKEWDRQLRKWRALNPNA